MFFQIQSKFLVCVKAETVPFKKYCPLNYHYVVIFGFILHAFNILTASFDLSFPGI